MTQVNRKILLYIGVAGLVLLIVGNYGKRLDLPLANFAWYLGIASIGIFWLYTIIEIIRSKFWTKDTKWKYLLVVILLPLVGPFIYYYFRNEIIAPDDYDHP